jgi:hypothetical protein
VCRRFLLLALSLSLAALGGPVQKLDAESFKKAVEADWLLQDTLRTGKQVAPKVAGNVTTKQDALGALDGVKDGKWGFHTADEDNPWWHVDLGEKAALDRVVLYNRCDTCTERNNRIILLLSDDGKAWQQAYQHNGTVFYGFTDKRPLEIKLEGKTARFVRLALKGTSYFHLDEVEVYPTGDPKKNIALGRPGDQSSVSEWSALHGQPAPAPAASVAEAPKVYPFATVLERGRKLAADLLASGAPVEAQVKQLDAVTARIEALPKDAKPEQAQPLYVELRWAVRRLALANPLLNFDQVLFVKRAPGSYSHMSDQHYGHWSRPGGGVFILGGLKAGQPTVTCLTPDMPVGSFEGPDLSHDGKRAVFAYCRFYPQMQGMGDKTDKKNIPDDAKYHIFEINVDGTGLRQLTKGRYDDFDPRYLPDGRVIFLSTRRGQAVVCGKESASKTLEDPFLPDSYVRCGGGRGRPVAVFTLHVMDPDGGSLRAISAFENFEWTPSIAPDGRILYARWDYVDRHNNAFMSLWSTHPDGTMPNLVYKNFTRSPHCAFEARSIPGSHKLLFTASAHHAITAGSICRLDTAVCTEAQEPLTRLTPEVCFPETEGWPATYYNNPYPLSENYYLVGWSPYPIHGEGSRNDTNCMGLYLADAFGNLELLHRDPAISSSYPLPLRPRPKPHALPEMAADGQTDEGRMLVLNVTRGLGDIPRGAVKRIRIIGTPAKTQPEMNSPNIGYTAEDPGKVILGTVPVEADGSAYFRIPAGICVFFQALDADGMAVQTMRTLTYVQPGQTLSCIGCHEQRQETPANSFAAALGRGPSPITPGPEGSWPLRYDRLVQPVLDKHCVKCHSPQGKPEALKKLNLLAATSYDALSNYGSPKLSDHVKKHYLNGYSIVGACAAKNSPILAMLRKGHNDLKLDADAFDRLATWMDTYGQRQGHFSPEQEQDLLRLRERSATLLAEKR